jgi:hypothetical protein
VQDESSGQHRGAGREILLANFSAWVRTKREQFQERPVNSILGYSGNVCTTVFDILPKCTNLLRKQSQPFAQTKPNQEKLIKTMI